MLKYVALYYRSRFGWLGCAMNFVSVQVRVLFQVRTLYIMNSRLGAAGYTKIRTSASSQKTRVETEVQGGQPITDPKRKRDRPQWAQTFAGLNSNPLRTLS